jgi:hypothetical protein
MSDAEKQACIAIGNGRYLPGTWDKRFARKMQEQALQYPEKELSEGQREQIRRIMHKYRKSVIQVTF